MKRAQKGFTLIEIMIVVAIIAILAAIAIPNFVSYRKTSQMNACIANLKSLDNATEAWRIKTNSPDGVPEMSALAPESGAASQADISSGKYYFKSALTCPGGGSYQKPTDATKGWTCTLGGTGQEYDHSTK